MIWLEMNCQLFLNNKYCNVEVAEGDIATYQGPKIFCDHQQTMKHKQSDK